MEHAILGEIVLVMAVAVISAALLRKIHIPPVVGFILAGMLIGPGGLGLVNDRHQIELVAEIGVMLLLFTVGLKLRMTDLWQLRGAVFGGGSAQVLITGGAVLAVVSASGRPLPQAIVWGAMIALSSTALVLWLLEGSGESGTRQGRTTISVLLFQDLAVVPIMLALPLLAGHATTTSEILWLLGRSVAVILLTIVGARVAFPWITHRIVVSGSRELFTLTTVLTAVGTALVFGYFGLSMALGAFLAGMVVSESEYVSQMVDHITPLRDVFNSLFFVSMGMLVEPRSWIERPALSLGLVAAVILGKALITSLVAWPVLRSPLAAVAVGLGLAQIGEFSIIVAAEAAHLGVLPPDQHQLFLAIAIPTMIFTPLLMGLGRRLARSTAVLSSPAASMSGHVVIVGYGVNGQNVARALTLLEIPHIVVDLNPYTVSSITEAGGLAFEGDAGRPEVLEAVGMKRARGLVAALADAASTRSVVQSAHLLNPEAQIIARTRYLREVEALYDLGAAIVVPEEFETSLELTGQVLSLYGASPRVIDREKAALRREGYGLLRGEERDHPNLETLCHIAQIERVVVPADSTALGQGLNQLEIRKKTGATVLAIERDADTVVNPAPQFSLSSGDALLVFADSTALQQLETLLGPKTQT